MINNCKKLCIFGNSMSILVSPNRRSLQDKSYSEIINDSGFIVNNASEQGITIVDFFRFFENELIKFRPNILVIQCGIVECTFRARPRFLHSFFSGNNWSNRTFNKKYVATRNKKFSIYIYKLYRIIEKIFFSIGIKWRYVNPRVFYEALNEFFLKCFQQSGVERYVIIGLYSHVHQLEAKAPGTISSINEYNNILKSFASKQNNTVFIDLDNLFKDFNSDDVTSDGIHLTSFGHAVLAKKILSEVCL